MFTISKMLRNSFGCRGSDGSDVSDNVPCCTLVLEPVARSGVKYAVASGLLSCDLTAVKATPAGKRDGDGGDAVANSGAAAAARSAAPAGKCSGKWRATDEAVSADENCG